MEKDMYLYHVQGNKPSTKKLEIMTTEFKNQLAEYSREDVSYATENGSHSICQTKNGLITIQCLGDCYQVYNNRNEQLTGVLTKNDCEEYIVSQYVIED
mgnify:CR=1 FL=1